MVKIVGVRFRNAGKVYYFDPKDYKIKPGDHVIVETARGIEYATVSGKVQEVADHKVVQPLKPVIRVANAEDDARAKRNREKEREAMAICKEKIRKHNLDMKLIDAEYTFCLLYTSQSVSERGYRRHDRSECDLPHLVFRVGQ